MPQKVQQLEKDPILSKKIQANRTKSNKEMFDKVKELEHTNSKLEKDKSELLHKVRCDGGRTKSALGFV